MSDITTIETVPLAVLAERIAHHAREADDRTLIAARLVREARFRVERGEASDITWYAWALKTIKLSPSRLRELQRIAAADDPQQELERIRAQTQRRVAKHRARTAALRNGGADDVRQDLIAFARSAPLPLVNRTLSYARALETAKAQPNAA